MRRSTTGSALSSDPPRWQRRWRSPGVRSCSPSGCGRGADRLLEGRGRRHLRSTRPRWVAPTTTRARRRSGPARVALRGRGRPPGRRRLALGRHVLFMLVVGQRQGVDAVAEPGVGGAVGKHVPEVPTAAGAHDLGAAHPQAAIRPLDDRPVGLRDRSWANPTPSRTWRRCRTTRRRSRRSGTRPHHQRVGARPTRRVRCRLDVARRIDQATAGPATLARSW